MPFLAAFVGGPVNLSGPSSPISYGHLQLVETLTILLDEVNRVIRGEYRRLLHTTVGLSSPPPAVVPVSRRTAPEAGRSGTTSSAAPPARVNHDGPSTPESLPPREGGKATH